MNNMHPIFTNIFESHFPALRNQKVSRFPFTCDYDHCGRLATNQVDYYDQDGELMAYYERCAEHTFLDEHLEDGWSVDIIKKEAE